METCVCSDKSFVMTKVILVAAPAKDTFFLLPQFQLVIWFYFNVTFFCLFFVFLFFVFGGLFFVFLVVCFWFFGGLFFVFLVVCFWFVFLVCF